MDIKAYKNKQDVAAGFSQYLADQILSCDTINVALSGGSTPKIVFDHLAQNFKDLPWQKLHVFWGDERCVPPTHEDSNYKMTADHLLSVIDIPHENIHRIRGESDPEQEAIRYGHELIEFLPEGDGLPRFDLVILGMGSDGHTASIFPDQLALWRSEKYCEPAVHPETGQKRITLTGQVINNAKQVAFLVTGADKRPMVTQIMTAGPDSKQYPAALVAPTSGNLLWFLDEAAYLTGSI